MRRRPGGRGWLPSRLVLVGRGWELGQLDRFVAAVQGGSGPVLALRGQAGIGKTALLSEARRAAEGCRVLVTTATESGSQLPYLGLTDLCGPVLEHLDGLPERQVAALRGALALGPAAPGDDLAVVLAAHALLRAEAAHRPVLVVADDLQWLDPDTARFLEYLVQRLGQDRIGVLLALRDDDVPEWVETLPFLEPSPLGDDDARSLVRSTTAALGPAAVDAVVQVASGNPLALLDLPASLDGDERSGLLAPAEPMVLGRRLQQAYDRRLDDLPVDVQRAVLLAAAAEACTRTELLEAVGVLGLDPSALRVAEDAGMLVTTGDRVQITHPLVRSAAYHRMPPGERRAAHEALGAVVQGPSRSWHLAAAASGPDEVTAAELEAAARDAQARHAHGAASRAFRRAAELSEEPTTRSVRRIHAVISALAASDRSTPRAWMDEDVATEGEPDLVRRLRAWAQANVMRASPETTRASIAGFAAVGDELAAAGSMRAAEAWADAAMAAIVVGDNRTVLELAERAWELVGPDAPAEARCPPLTALAYGTIATGDVTRGRVAAAELDRAIGEVDAGSTAMRSVPLALQAQAALGDLDGLRERTQRLTEATREAGAYKRAALLGAVHADLSYRCGDWAACEQEVTEAVGLFRQIGQPMGLFYALCVEARLRAARGEAEQVRQLAAEVLGACDPPGSDVLAAYALGALGLLELGNGNVADAIERLSSLAARMRHQGLEEPSLLPWRADLAEALLAAGRRGDAASVVEELEHQATACESAPALAAAARLRGLLASTGFEEHFSVAVLWHERLPMPFERARTELALGSRLRRANRRADARVPLRSAQDTFEALGARPWAARAAEELRAAGGRARRPAGDPTQLTDREARVAAAAATGATNREIAAELFISVKTVEFHLARVFDKLGVRTRSELAARMARA